MCLEAPDGSRRHGAGAAAAFAAAADPLHTCRMLSSSVCKPAAPEPLPSCPTVTFVQALVAHARAFSTQTEIAVVSGLPPLDVGRKVRAAAGA